jgi:hypothetical protein
MKITVTSQWQDETQSILLHQHYRGNWTLDDHYELVDETNVLLDHARHPSDVIIDFTETAVPVSRLLSVVNLIVLNYVNGRIHNRQRPEGETNRRAAVPAGCNRLETIAVAKIVKLAPRGMTWKFRYFPLAIRRQTRIPLGQPGGRCDCSTIRGPVRWRFNGRGE